MKSMAPQPEGTHRPAASSSTLEMGGKTSAHVECDCVQTQLISVGGSRAMREKKLILAER